MFLACIVPINLDIIDPMRYSPLSLFIRTEKNMVRIRLKRMGRRHRPFYRVVAADQRSQEMDDTSKFLDFMIP